MSILDQMNQAQREAVLHQEGPCLVLAGAGSGKTSVLTGRVAQLVENGVSPHEIMAITFTNKAAQEMKERVSRVIPGFHGNWIRTFHSASYQILRMEIENLGYRKDFTILDESEQKALIKECLAEWSAGDVKPEVVSFLIKQAKNSLKDPENYFHSLRGSFRSREDYVKVYRLYQRRLRELNALDFEDLIGLTIQLFRSHPDVLADYHDRFRYVMIDEYQDTNYAQFVWANLLAGPRGNLFVVGDPDQSIYSWRGAEPYNIERFLQEYPQARVVKLEKNYRSTQFILDAANAVIRNNPGRMEKNLFTDNTEGERLVQFCAANHQAEGEFVVQVIKQLTNTQGLSYKDFAVFYRTHAQSRVFEEVFNRSLIPYRIVGALKFYQRKEIKDILGYLRLIANPSDRMSFRRVVNTPRRGVGEVTLKKLEDISIENNISIIEALARLDEIKGLGSKVKEALRGFYGMMQFLSDLAPNVSLGELIGETIELSGYVDDLKANSPLDAEERIENLKEFQSLVLEFEKEGKKELVDFLAEVALLQETDGGNDNDNLLMMTYHAAKGLEFPVVFMTGMEEGVFPSYRAETEDQMEEERRICYVGITRARQRLFMTRATCRILYGSERYNMPSRFLKEVPDDLFDNFLFIRPAAGFAGNTVRRGIQAPMADTDGSVTTSYEPGDLVTHRKFGRGIVIAADERDVIVVDFAQYGEKTLAAGIAPLVKLSGEE